MINFLREAQLLSKMLMLQGYNEFLVINSFFANSKVAVKTLFVLALTTGNPECVIPTKAHGGCDRSALDACNSSMARDPTFTLSEVCDARLCVCRLFWIVFTLKDIVNFVI
jgi:hypothetical protein